MPGGVALPGLLLLAFLCALAVSLSGCGRGAGDGGDAKSEKEADVELLNGVLSRQLGAVDAYERTIPGLRGTAAAAAKELRAQEQEHADAIVKALRALGGEAGAEPEEVDLPKLRTRTDRLGFLFELEGATIDYELNIVTRLNQAWPRGLLGSIVANQAQHRVLLRQLLGQPGTEAIPEAFEDGSELSAVPPTGKE